MIDPVESPERAMPTDPAAARPVTARPVTGTTIRVLCQRGYGGPEVLELVETARPVPGSGEVLVRVRAAGVNPADWKIREGLVRRFGEPPFAPGRFVPGLDFAGVVAESGPEAGPGPGTDPGTGSGTGRFSPGEPVFGCVFPPAGSYAEWLVAPEGAVARAPRTLDAVHAAALPVAALTAWQPLVRVAGVTAGQRVLVHAAAGGVGHLAVQIAKARGAHVVATARATNHGFLRDLGVDELIDYTARDFTTAVDPVDLVLDPVSGEYGLRSLAVVRDGGALIDVRGTGPDRAAIRERARRLGVRYVEFGFTPSGDDLAAIAELVDAGALRVAVEHVLPLREAARAQEINRTGHGRGKIVLTL